MIKKIKIENFAVLKKAEIEIEENSNVYPIIGLNGVGKSIFLDVIENILDTSFIPEKMRPKFNDFKNNDKIIEPQIEIVLDEHILQGGIDKREINENFPIFGSRTIENKRINELGYSAIYKYPLFSKKEFLFLPFKVDDTLLEKMDKFKKTNKQKFTDYKTKINSLSKKIHNSLKEEVPQIIIISQEKANRLSEVIDETDKILDINKKDNPEGFDFVNTILSLYSTNWKSELKKNLDNWKKGDHKNSSSHTDITKQVNDKLEDFLNPTSKSINNLSKKENELIERIMLVISGRYIKDDSSIEEIKDKSLITKPTIALWNANDDYHIKLGFTEIDNIQSNIINKDEVDDTIIKSEAVYSGLSSKNDGYKFIFYLIYILKFKKINPKTLILIDELGNYLNPKLLNYLIQLLNIFKGNFIYTTHNPYALSMKNVNQIHVCSRLRSEPYSELKHIKYKLGRNEEDIYSAIRKKGDSDHTLKIIEHAFALEINNIDFRISNTKTNIVVEGITDWIILNMAFKFTDLNFIPVGGKSSVYPYFYKFSTWNLGNDFGAILDEDWKDDSLLKKGDFPKELEKKLYSKISSFKDLNKNFEEPEDILIKLKFECVEIFRESKKKELQSWNSYNFKKIKEINNKKLKKELKSEIAKELYNVMSLSEEKLIESNPKYKQLIEIMNSIVNEYLNRNKGNEI